MQHEPNRWGNQFEPDKLGKLPSGAIVATVINRDKLILKVSDGPCSKIEAYDGHAALTFDRDYPTAAELEASTAAPGYYATCKAEGLMRPFGHFNGKPAFGWGALVA